MATLGLPRQLYLLTITTVTLFLANETIQPVLSLYITEKGASTFELGIIISLLSFVAIGAKIPLGLLTEHVGKWPIIPAVAVGQTISLLLYSIARNARAHTDQAIYLDMSYDGRIYHNNFIDNGPPYLYFSRATWDDGYPSGGNYWSDYEERYPGVEDAHSGLHQNETGSDNVWDDPYEINEDNTDRYPLVNSYTQAETYETYVEVVPETMEFGDGGVNVIGTRFSVAVVVEDVENLMALDVTLRYNVAYLQYTSHQTTIPVEAYPTAVPPSPHPGILHQPAFKVKDEANPTLGEIWISCSSLPPAPSFNGSGTLFVATFEIVRQLLQPQVATLTLEIHSGTLVDELADPIQHTREHGTVIIRGVAQDVNAPTTTASLSGLEGTGGWFTSDVLVTLSATDDVSGVDQTEYSFDNSTWVTYTSPFTGTDEGNTIIYFRSTDNVGNVESTAAETIEMDKTAPEADAGNNQTVDVGATVAFDGIGSTDNVGLVSFEWDFGDGATGTGETATHAYTNPGDYTVTLTVKDAAATRPRTR